MILKDILGVQIPNGHQFSQHNKNYEIMFIFKTPDALETALLEWCKTASVSKINH